MYRLNTVFQIHFIVHSYEPSLLIIFGLNALMYIYEIIKTSPNCVACVCHITQVDCETVHLHEAVKSVGLTDDHIIDLLSIYPGCHATNIDADVFV